MITDEMVEAAAAAAWRKDYPQGGSMYRTYESTNFHDKELYRKDARIILNAAYPLIRKQILEEAARACNSEARDAYKRGADFYGATCEDCAQAIRNLAGGSQA